MSGVYLITNRINGKRYVGQSRNIYNRFCCYRSRRKRTEHLSIYRAIRKYGIENFSFSVIEDCSVEKLFEREIFWIEQLSPEYNRNRGGKGNPRPMSAETRARLSVAAKKQWAAKTASERRATLANLTGPRKGHAVSSETRRKIRKALRGRSIPAHVRAKMSATNRVAMRGKISDSQVVGRFPSVKSAASRVGIHSSGITAVLKRRQKTAAGFDWQLAA